MQKADGLRQAGNKAQKRTECRRYFLNNKERKYERIPPKNRRDSLS